jgi:carboxyl-terminal processing protease
MNFKCSALAAALLSANLSAYGQTAPEKKQLPTDELRALSATYQVLGDALVTPIDGKKLIVSAIRGMVRGADPDDGEYFTEEELAAFKSRSSANSLGLVVRLRNGQFVLTPLEGGSSIEAGIQVGDQLLAIDGARTRKMDAQEVERLLAEAKSDKVSLTVFRDSSLAVLSIAVERRAFQSPGPSVARVSPAVALLRIRAFASSTLRDSALALKSEWQTSPFQALILDLRGCPGGVLETSVGVAAMFLPPGTTVAIMRGAAPDSQQVFRASKEDYDKRGTSDPLAELPPQVRRLPLAVLVDAGTAAGAEIVAAALKDHKRAVVYGQQTFGRGSIQTITALGGYGAVKFTSAFWVSPSGASIQRAGVTPDALVTGTDSQAAIRTATSALLARP